MPTATASPAAGVRNASSSGRVKGEERVVRTARQWNSCSGERLIMDDDELFRAEISRQHHGPLARLVGQRLRLL